MKKLLLALFACCFLTGVAVLPGISGQPAAYKIEAGDARWSTKLNAGLDALWDYDTASALIISSWVGVQSYQTSTYIGTSSFSVVGDLTSKYSAGQLLFLNQGVDGVAANIVVSSSYGAGITTIVVTTANLTANLAQAQILNPTASDIVVAADYGTNQAALIAADVVAAAAGKQLVIGRTYSITSTPASPLTANLKVMPGAVISVATGTTLTINGTLDAGLYQIFSCAGTGKPVFGAGAVKEIYPQWFGSVGDGATTNDTALLQTFQCASDSGGVPVKIIGDFAISAQAGIDPPANLKLHGTSPSQSVIRCVSASPQNGIRQVVAGDKGNVEFKNIKFVGNSKYTVSNFDYGEAILIKSATSVTIEDCEFENFPIAAAEIGYTVIPQINIRRNIVTCDGGLVSMLGFHIMAGGTVIVEDIKGTSVARVVSIEVPAGLVGTFEDVFIRGITVRDGNVSTISTLNTYAGIHVSLDAGFTIGRLSISDVKVYGSLDTSSNASDIHVRCATLNSIGSLILNNIQIMSSKAKHAYYVEGVYYPILSNLSDIDPVSGSMDRYGIGLKYTVSALIQGCSFKGSVLLYDIVEYGGGPPSGTQLLGNSWSGVGTLSLLSTTNAVGLEYAGLASGLKTLAIVAGGTGYTPGTVVLTVVQSGASLGKISCTASAGGIITSIDSITAVGSGYSVASPLATTGGGNNDCTVNLSAITGFAQANGLGWYQRVANAWSKLPKLLYNSGASLSTSGDGEDTLHSITVRANTMGTNGQVKIRAFGTKTGVVANKTIKLYFGATSFTVFPAANNTNLWSFEAVIINFGTAAAQRVHWKFTDAGTVTQGVSSATIDTTADVLVKITGECVDGGDAIVNSGCEIVNQ